jgi:acetoin utilization deacetylase AcuC-like enzyme
MIGAMALPTLIVQEGGYRTRTLGTNARFFFEGLYAGHNGRENKGLFSVGRCKEKGRF